MEQVDVAELSLDGGVRRTHISQRTTGRHWAKLMTEAQLYRSSMQLSKNAKQPQWQKNLSFCLT